MRDKNTDARKAQHMLSELGIWLSSRRCMQLLRRRSTDADVPGSGNVPVASVGREDM